jgi:probable O-glycosylation ligase (exosortase A-associated)
VLSQATYRLSSFRDQGLALAAVAVLGTVWYLQPDPLTPIAMAGLAVLLVSAIAAPFLACLAFIVFSFFRIHEAYPFLYNLHLPFLLGAATVLGLSAHVFVVRSVKPAWSPELVWFAAFFVLATAGVAFAYNRDVSWAFWSDVYWKIGLMTFAVAWLPHTLRDFRSAAVAFVIGGILVSAVTIYNHYNAIGLVELSRVTIGRELNSLLADPNDLALVLLFPLSFSIALALPQNRPLHRFLGIAAILAIVPAVIFTQSRGGLLGVLAVIFVYGLRQVRSKTLVILLTLAAAVLLYASMGIAGRISGGAQDALDESAQERLSAWGAAINMATARPLTGVGLANFAPAFFYYVKDFPGRDMTSHSTWFGVLGETGWPGIALFAMMIIATFRSGVSAYRTLRAQRAPPILATFAFALLAGLVGFCVAGSFLTQGFTWPIYLLVGLTAAIRRYSCTEMELRVPFEPNFPLAFTRQ